MRPPRTPAIVWEFSDLRSVDDEEYDWHRTVCPEGRNGPAVTHCCERADGTLWAGNDEYETQVNFCPFTGRKAKVPARVIPEGA